MGNVKHLENGDVLEFNARLSRRIFQGTYDFLELYVPSGKVDMIMDGDQCFHVTMEAIDDPWFKPQE